MTDDSLLSVDQTFALAATFQPDAQGRDTFTLDAGVLVDATVNLPGITIVVEGIKLAVGLGITPGSGVSAGLTAELPTGASATVNLPALRGEGDLVSSPDGSWAGALLLQLGTLSVDAFALIGGGDPDVSFVIVLCARFPQPGIQIGFGFAVSAWAACSPSTGEATPMR